LHTPWAAGRSCTRQQLARPPQWLIGSTKVERFRWASDVLLLCCLGEETDSRWFQHKHMQKKERTFLFVQVASHVLALCKSQAASLLCNAPTSMEACVEREDSLGLYTNECKKNWEMKPHPKLPRRGNCCLISWCCLIS
jgi:hypothetical protein